VKHLAAAELDVSRETLARLAEYVGLLQKWNPVINLVSKRDAQDLWARHIRDCIQLQPLMPPGVASAIDLGSGGGLPGVVLAITSGVHFHLVEGDLRKATFLREAARICEAPVTVHAERIEAITLVPALLVTARALAPLPQLLALAERFLAPTGVLLAPKGRNAEAELTAAARQWHMRVARTASITNPDATIFHITEVTRVGHLTSCGSAQ
jgi:16S rRNA (guanine527-N7)-methyltransferase